MIPTFVTVIEAGPLEKQVCLLVESLRRWGGRVANAPVFVVRPRRGPNISKSTRRTLEKLNAEYLSIERTDGFEWFPYLNKTAAVMHVAGLREAVITWLDADVIVIAEPAELLDVAVPELRACASDKNIGTASNHDEFAPYFKAACAAVGVDFASLPYVVTEAERIPIRVYWNSGVYAFHTETGLAELHHRFTLSLLEKGVASRSSKLYFSDQISLGLAAHALQLQNRKLPLSHNFALVPQTSRSRLEGYTKEVCLVHYHDCLWPTNFDSLCAGLAYRNPEVADWLRAKGPLKVDMYAVPRIHRKLLGLYREREHRAALLRANYY